MDNYDDDIGRSPHFVEGWWIFPSVVIGVAFWLYIFWSVIIWLFWK